MYRLSAALFSTAINKDTLVHVANLPTGVTHKQLSTVFHKWNPLSIKIITINKLQQKSRFRFFTFTNELKLIKAIQNANNDPFIIKHDLRLTTSSTVKNQMFVGNVRVKSTLFEKSLLACLAKFGAIDVTLPKPYAIIQFKNIEIKDAVLESYKIGGLENECRLVVNGWIKTDITSKQ
jgi:hypothetical protein